MWHDGPEGWGWIMMAGTMALFWVPLLVALVWLARRFEQPATRDDGSETQPIDAPEIARRAYARGEHSRERFFAIMADLEEPPGGRPDKENNGT